MTMKVMVCGVDCHPGEGHCNGYCLGICDTPPPATPEMKLAFLREQANEKLREAEKAWYAYFCECNPGKEREGAHEVYLNVLYAKRIHT